MMLIPKKLNKLIFYLFFLHIVSFQDLLSPKKYLAVLTKDKNFVADGRDSKAWLDLMQQLWILGAHKGNGAQWSTV